MQLLTQLVSLEFSASCGGDLGVRLIVWDRFYTLCRCCGMWHRLIKEERISSDVEERTEEVREVSSLLQ